jgi:pectate lyase
MLVPPKPRRSPLASMMLIASLALGSCGDDGEPRELPTDSADDESEATGKDSGVAPRADGSIDASTQSPGRTPSARDAARDSEIDGSTRPALDGSRASGEGASEGGAAQSDARQASANDASGGEEPAPGSCPSALVGWATQGGDGVNATTGGGNAAPVRPKSAAELMMYASDSTPRVIEVAGTFDVPKLQIASNKTLLGIGRDATIRGGLRIRGNDSAPVSNVIIRNLRVDGAKTEVDNDAVQLYFAHHVWIDHCEIWDGPDGNLDMTHAVNWITVSWTKLRYSEAYMRPSGESSDHRFASLVGHSDNNAEEDTGRIKVTFHHNWWAERVIERMPRVRFGQVHVFNNYFASPGNNYCVRAGFGARLLIEGNYFDQVNSPHEFNSSDDEATAHITARNNVYNMTTGTQAMNGGGMPFTSVPYSATIEPAERVPSVVRACAGPR